jgi:phage shock protein PspC (stress-responsive transcriptional regulator)
VEHRVNRVTRDTENAILGGVAAGLGRHFGLDPVLVRIAFVMVALAHGAGVLFYILCWLVIPRDARSPTPADRATARLGETGERVVETLKTVPGRGRLAFGCFLILLGSILMLDRIPGFHWPAWASLETLWPLVLVALGAAIIARSRGAEAT